MRGFGLAGVAGRAVSTAAEASSALQAVVAQDDHAVILLTQEFARPLASLLDSIRFERERPLILELPGPDGPLPGTPTLRELAEEAVGLRID